MKTHYDRDADALFVRFAESEIIDTEEISPGIMIDRDETGKIVAIEFLDARNQLAAHSLDGIAAE